MVFLLGLVAFRYWYAVIFYLITTLSETPLRNLGLKNTGPKGLFFINAVI